jgi:uncharacterized membrane protein YozB (DUF420 family)
MRLGFLGNDAPYAADLNLVAQLAVLCMLLAGLYFVRTSKLRTHGRLMKSAVIAQFGALILWMGPSLVLSIGMLRSFGPGPITTALHVLAGGFALALAISAIYHKKIGSLQLKWTMRSTFIVWTSAAVLGIGFYAYYYLH